MALTASPKANNHPILPTYSSTSKAVMSASRTGIRHRSLTTAPSCAVKATWEGFGNGRVHLWWSMRDSSPWISTRPIRVSGSSPGHSQRCLDASLILHRYHSADFFDGKHNIVLGGSWATHPRVAGRKSLFVLPSQLLWFSSLICNSVNWYQRKYPYAWCGARLVRKA